MNSFHHLSKEQQAAASAAARLAEEAEMRFVFLMFSQDGQGAVISNIDPGDAVPLLEGALAAAKGGVAIEDIDNGRERLQ